MHIQCTEDLIAQFDPQAKYRSLSPSFPNNFILGSWYATTLNIADNEFLMYVHTKSLYSTLDIIDYPEDPMHVQSFTNLRGKILDMLQEHYFLSDWQMDQLLSPFKKVTFGCVENKRMMRIIKAIAKTYEHRFFSSRMKNNGEVRLWELEDDLNNYPRRILGGATPANILSEMVWAGIS